jgi:hypothetical protein
MVRDPVLVHSDSNASPHIVNVGTTPYSLGVIDSHHPVLVPNCCYTWFVLTMSKFGGTLPGRYSFWSCWLFQKVSPFASSTTQRTTFRQYDISLVGAFRAGFLAGPIYRRFAEMGSRICAGCVDVVVFGEVAHGGIWKCLSNTDILAWFCEDDPGKLWEKGSLYWIVYLYIGGPESQ